MVIANMNHKIYFFIGPSSSGTVHIVLTFFFNNTFIRCMKLICTRSQTVNDLLFNMWYDCVQQKDQSTKHRVLTTLILNCEVILLISVVYRHCE